MDRPKFCAETNDAQIKRIEALESQLKREQQRAADLKRRLDLALDVLQEVRLSSLGIRAQHCVIQELVPAQGRAEAKIMAVAIGAQDTCLGARVLRPKPERAGVKRDLAR